MQNIGIHSIEDCLEIITGLQKHNLKFEIDSSDSVIINSIARQVFKGTALTDRQYNLMKEKLLNYKEQFEQQNVVGFERALGKLRNPLRTIDRSKYIKIANFVDCLEIDEVHESWKSDYKWIKIRFPFNKKTIVKIEKLLTRHIKDYHHKRGTHIHCFLLKENIIKDVVETFSSSEFEIDKELIEIYNKIKMILDNTKDHFSSVCENTIYNFSDRLHKTEKLSSLDNRMLYDRRFRYSIDFFDYRIDVRTLSDQIATRETVDIQLEPTKVSTTQIFDSIEELNRWPLIVVLPSTDREAHRCILDVYKNICNFVHNSEQSVLFRLDNNDIGFNDFIKDKTLNNWVDKDTKIVYISNNKLPKVLLKTDWNPMTAIIFDSHMNKNVNTYIKDYCDCIILREENISPFRRYSKYYG